MQEKLFKLAGVAAIISGLLFTIIQIIHPEDSLNAIGTTQWMITHIMTFGFPIFGLLGLTGIYLRQANQAGYLGLLGYLSLFGAFVLMICFGFYEAFVAPGLVEQAPGYVLSVMSILDGEAGPQYVGTVYQVNGALYLLGGLMFGFATLKAKIFPRWASGLLIAGVLVTLSAAIVPTLARPSAVVFSIGLAALGYSLVMNSGKRNRLSSQQS